MRLALLDDDLREALRPFETRWNVVHALCLGVLVAPTALAIAGLLCWWIRLEPTPIGLATAYALATLQAPYAMELGRRSSETLRCVLLSVPVCDSMCPTGALLRLQCRQAQRLIRRERDSQSTVSLKALGNALFTEQAWRISRATTRLSTGPRDHAVPAGNAVRLGGPVHESQHGASNELAIR